MKFEMYVNHGKKLLRCGYTTGSAAAMGAKACATALLKGEIAHEIRITVPKGVCVTADADVRLENDFAVCKVIKDGGDDVDATHGATIITKVELCVGGIYIDGGQGVGRVTKPGLNRSVGAAAINSVPRAMIEKELREVASETGYSGGFTVTVSVENGEEIAKKTFNPNLGIVGGISILGTSGIVEPMSLDAIKQSIEVELNMHEKAGEKNIIITPGNYGEDFLKDRGFSKNFPVVKCSNFIGDTLDMAMHRGFEIVLVVGHIGKIIKLAAGIMNTHSKFADGRAEIFTSHAAVAGCSNEVANEIFRSATTDGSIEILKREGLYEQVMRSILAKIHSNLKDRTTMKVGAVTFSNVHGYIGATSAGHEIIGMR